MTIYWILKKTKSGKLVFPPGGLEGFPKKEIKSALDNYHMEYPKSTFVVCKQVFQEVDVGYKNPRKTPKTKNCNKLDEIINTLREKGLKLTYRKRADGRKLYITVKTHKGHAFISEEHIRPLHKWFHVTNYTHGKCTFCLDFTWDE